MIPPDREQLERDCADALEALTRDQSVTGNPKAGVQATAHCWHCRAEPSWTLVQ